MTDRNSGPPAPGMPPPLPPDTVFNGTVSAGAQWIELDVCTANGQYVGCIAYRLARPDALPALVQKLVEWMTMQNSGLQLVTGAAASAVNGKLKQ